ncbi:MAG: efflux RND transporter periplasmic adaptor subunit [Lachnospiraceae bacterium]|nr:efflux RND transporter periplasmic adaptor subunit [Lachnospiraceae bacterium]
MRRKDRTERTGLRKITTTLLLATLLFACGNPEEEVPPLVLEGGDEAAEYSLTECMRGTVEETAALSCIYRKNAEQEVYFPVSGKLIRRICVGEGDHVKQGDLLAELSVGNVQDQIDELEYRIKRSNMQLGYIDEQEKLDIANLYLNYVTSPKMIPERYENEDDAAYEARVKQEADWDYADYEYSIQKLKTQNDQRRNSLRDSIEFDTKKLNNLRGQLAQSRIYAKFDGKVSSVERGLVGSTSNVEKCVMKIVDDQEGYFETTAADLMPYLTQESYSMKVMFGNGRGEYELIPRDKDQWGEKQYFAIKRGDNIDGLEVDDKGEINIVTARKENTLYLPKESVRNAGDRYYVYTVGEDGLRNVVWVEVGLRGDGVIEILSGLNEGDKVIRRG